MKISGSRGPALAAIACAAALSATACGGDAYSPGGGSGDNGAPPSFQPGHESSLMHARQVGALGQVITDHEGYTLYRFDKDTAKPAKSNCADTCAVQWPPVLADGNFQVEGIDPALVSTVERADGAQQVTVGGWPLYRFFQDAKPGESRGHGKGGTWHAATPDGKKAAAPANGGTASGY
ncbi:MULTISPECIES: hypothetical protein [unclassified Crossiella]|uniref:hypothetical protein n=1 Tax=unclassified Crossiella TaxID=2620835 RepID=UPI001FFF0587|nr:MULTISPECIES: hypothetical protein [unclassified Crossiella]MCK2243080.1 hypothetical protein [Crossiella sp. S99.2]MCK2256957.1 hypothetical protein [Crossiella sp. S99.1]